MKRLLAFLSLFKQLLEEVGSTVLRQIQGGNETTNSSEDIEEIDGTLAAAQKGTRSSLELSEVSSLQVKVTLPLFLDYSGKVAVTVKSL